MLNYMLTIASWCHWKNRPCTEYRKWSRSRRNGCTLFCFMHKPCCCGHWSWWWARSSSGPIQLLSHWGWQRPGCAGPACSRTPHWCLPQAERRKILESFNWPGGGVSLSLKSFLFTMHPPVFLHLESLDSWSCSNPRYKSQNHSLRKQGDYSEADKDLLDLMSYIQENRRSFRTQLTGWQVYLKRVEI